MFDSKRRRILLALAAAAVLAVGGAAIAGAAGGDDDGGEDDKPITGQTLDRASAAALEHTGGGRVTDTETGDEESQYEVEVTLEDGTQVDVQLDRDFKVVGDEREDEDED